MVAPDWDALFGFDDRHVVTVSEHACLRATKLHPDVVPALEELRSRAAIAGFDLRVLSGFRSFDRQRRIWNAKADGERVVLDAEEQPVDVGTMEPMECVRTILCWSALPGLSRHHWGTDFDVVDAAAMPAGFEPSLTVAEWSATGPFAELGRWFDELELKGDFAGFFRPYDGYRCAVAREPWHLSLEHCAAVFQRELMLCDVRAVLDSKDIRHWGVISPALEELIDQYANVRPATTVGAGRP